MNFDFILKSDIFIKSIPPLPLYDVHFWGNIGGTGYVAEFYATKKSE